MTRTPSPQTTEGLGATPLTALWADLEAASREPGPTMTITKAQYAALRGAARLSVPSEALAEALQASPMLRRFVQWNPSLYGALADEVLAALPNREDAPWTEADIPVPDLEPWEAPVVREDAPSREGLDVTTLAGALYETDPPESWMRTGTDEYRKRASAMLAIIRAALAATPPGDREAKHEHTPDCSSRFARDGVTGEAICDCGIEEAAVATAEAAAGEEGS